MGRFSMVYNAKEADDLNKNELIKAILEEYGVDFNESIIRAMAESFRCGFIRGEEYAKTNW